MNSKRNHVSKRHTGRKIAIALVAAVATVAAVVGIYSTSMWAGTGYDYQGNEISRALPVTKESGNSSGYELTNGTKESHAQVFVTDNVRYPSTGGPDKSPKLEKLDAPGGAVNVVQNPSYPQTGDKVNYSAVIAGLMLILGLVLVYRKDLKLSLFKKK